MFNEIKFRFKRKILIQTFFVLFSAQMSLAQGYWIKAGDLSQIRYGHTVDEINGQIYIVGGDKIEGTTPPTTALIFDRASGEWSQVPLLNNLVRAAHGSCVVEGKLYVIGGTDGINTIATVEMFDPGTGEWTSKKSLPDDKSLFGCVSIDEKIYVLGGIRDYNYVGLNEVEVYDTKEDTWTKLADMPAKRWGNSAVAFNGKIYVFGGVTFGATNTVYKSVEVYDPQTNTWITKSSMPTPRYCLTSCLLDSSIYVIGGWYHSSNGPLYDKVEIYNPLTDEWKQEIPLPAARALLASIVLDGKVYVYGGARTTHPNYGTSEIYELSYNNIFSLQPYVDKYYAKKNLDSVLFRTRFANIYDHQFTPFIICRNSDSTQIDSLNLFDDGLHGDSLANDGLYGVNIPPRQNEDFYNLTVGTLDNQTDKYYYTPDRSQFTTAGPLVIDSIEAKAISNIAYSIKPYLKNKSATWNFNKLLIKIYSDDPWVTSVVPYSRQCTNIWHGEIKTDIQPFVVYYDSSTFPGYCNLKYEISFNGFTYWIDSIQVKVSPVGIDGESYKPLDFSLEQNYPNPFNPSTTLSFVIGHSSLVTLKIYDVLGNEIATLVNEEKSAGTYEVTWNAEGLSSGVYFYQLKAGDFVETKKMIMLR